MEKWLLLYWNKLKLKTKMEGYKDNPSALNSNKKHLEDANDMIRSLMQNFSHAEVNESLQLMTLVVIKERESQIEKLNSELKYLHNSLEALKAKTI